MNNMAKSVGPGRFDRYSSGWLAAMSYAILLAAGVALLFLWDSLPERWPIHWGASGQPNGWAAKSPTGVFLPILLGLVICTLLEVVVRWSLDRLTHGGGGRKLAPAAADAIGKLTIGFVRLLEFALATVFAGMALILPLAPPARPGKLVLASFLWVAGFIGFGMWRLKQGAAEMKAAGLTQGVEGWNGLTYRNPNDPRLWVPKITGIGYTLNFAHRLAWLIMAALLAIPLFALLAVIVSSI